MSKKIAIIGGGASGLLCAILCARESLKVDLYEQNSKCAKKILVSGNGRCNITNTSTSSKDYFSQEPYFVNDALELFSFKEFEKFASSLGLLLETKNNGKVYPLSNEAKSVALLLENSARNLGVTFHLDTRITDIQKLMQSHDSVVVATGSEAAEHLGGNKDGQEFAKHYGHNIVPTYPSLVQLELNSSSHAKMNGSKVEGEVSLLINNKKTISRQGDILFTAYGVSGFAILDISQLASESLLNFQAVDIVVNLLPKFTAQKLSSHIQKTAQCNNKSTILDILHGLLNLKIAKTLLDFLDIPHTTVGKSFNIKEIKKISNQILNWKFEVTNTHGFRHGEVAGGGVDVSEINSKTMESSKKKNLYFCGEVLDVLGKRGGFNFAWAWASAYVCAKDISKT